MSDSPQPNFPRSAKIAALAIAVLLILGALDVHRFIPDGIALSVGNGLGLAFGIVVLAILAYTFWEILADIWRALMRKLSGRDRP